jgi:hypothetical protein
MAFDPLRFANEMFFRKHFEVTAQDFESMKKGRKFCVPPLKKLEVIQA